MVVVFILFAMIIVTCTVYLNKFKKRSLGFFFTSLIIALPTTFIYFNNSFNLEVRQQSEDRAHRHGQTKSVTYIDLIADKTLDEFILKILNSKMKLSAQTLGEEVVKFL